MPALDQAAQQQSQQLLAQIQQRIHQQGGWLSFADFMQMALYLPHLGYYSGARNKFGAKGDFVTAPELTPLFAHTLAQQVQEVLRQDAGAPSGDVLELGAGSGKLAAGLLNRLAALEACPQHYFILEVSADLRARQQETLRQQLPAALFERVRWLDSLPERLHGVIIANEVLDAIPVHLMRWQAGAWYERGVVWQNNADAASAQTASQTGDLAWQDRLCTDATLWPPIDKQALSEGYTTEVCPAAQGLVASLADCLEQGLLLFLDYGFSASEYYHPQRSQGTLMCHFQHRAHDQPLWAPGWQDITAHVDFTAMAEAGLRHGLSCAGYTSQAQFLINCGLLQALQAVPVEDSARYLPQAAAVQTLLSPAEMGELFKVLALSRGIALPLRGFVQGDRRHQL